MAPPRSRRIERCTSSDEPYPNEFLNGVVQRRRLRESARRRVAFDALATCNVGTWGDVVRPAYFAILKSDPGDAFVTK